MTPAPSPAPVQARAGLIFSDVSVRALLMGFKTQTRRLVKVPGQCVKCKAPADTSCGVWLLEGFKDGAVELAPCRMCRTRIRVKAPLAVGDVVYAKEAWTVIPADLMGRSHIVRYRADGASARHDSWYASGPGVHIHGSSDLADYDDSEWYGKWRSPMFMPRAAARLFFDVVAVRCDRLVMIDDADVLAEGLGEPPTGTPKAEFFRVWDELHTKSGNGWHTNPVVWAYTLRRRPKP